MERDDADASSAARRVYTDGDTSSRRPGVRSVVNEGLRAAGLTRASTVGNIGRRVHDMEGRNRTMSDARLGDELVSSPTTFSSRERPRESIDLTRSGGSSRLSARDRSSSRLSTDDRDRDGGFTEIDKLRERTRISLLSPNVRPPVTIHNLLNDRHTGESPIPSHRELSDDGRRDTRRDTIDATGRRNGIDLRRDTIIPSDGRETPVNLRAFQSAYRGSTMQAQSSLKAYTSPSGVQRILPPRPNTSVSADMSVGNVFAHAHAHHSASASTGNLNLITSSPSSGPSSAIGGGSGGSGKSDPIQLLTDALYMFESHISRLPHSNTMPETYNDVLRDAKGIVNAAVGLDMALRAAQGVCVEEMIEAEVSDFWLPDSFVN
jgi:hypothetical protein